MITAKTCLILGAGASAPYRLPPGKSLRDLILSMRVPTGGVTALNYPVIRSDGVILDYKTISNPRITAELRPEQARKSWQQYLNQACRDYGFTDGQIADFRNLFYRARRQSIDKFIEFNETEHGEIGRVNIAAPSY